jgi:hypothetical protein
MWCGMLRHVEVKALGCRIFFKMLSFVSEGESLFHSLSGIQTLSHPNDDCHLLWFKRACEMSFEFVFIARYRIASVW